MSSPVQQKNLCKKILGRSHVKTHPIWFIYDTKNQPTNHQIGVTVHPAQRHHCAEVASQLTGCCRFLLGQHPSKKQKHILQHVSLLFSGNLCIWPCVWASENSMAFPGCSTRLFQQKRPQGFFPGICLTMHQSARIHPYSNVIETPPGQRIPEINPK